MRPQALASLAATAFILATQSASAAPLRDTAGPYEVQVLVDGVPVPTYQHDGETYVLGQLGDRYTIRIQNRSGRRIEAVASVDGRDVIDGRPGDYRNKRGYLVPAYGSVDIDGWRLSNREAAAFRFSRVADSYAARMGHGREVGVVGVAVFPERVAPPPRPVYMPQPRPTTPWTPWGRANGAGDAQRGPAPEKSADAAEPMPTTPSAGATASAEQAPRAKKAESRSGLGTEFGEAVSSQVVEVPFVRQDASRPSSILGMRYNDHDGLVALGIDVDGDGCPSCVSEEELRRSAEPFPSYDRGYAVPPPSWRR